MDHKAVSFIIQCWSRTKFLFPQRFLVTIDLLKQTNQSQTSGTFSLCNKTEPNQNPSPLINGQIIPKIIEHLPIRHISFILVCRVFKFKPIQNKTVNRSKKTENRKKPNIFGCVWTLFCKNRYDQIGFRITFSKPNQTTKVNINTYLFS